MDANQRKYLEGLVAAGGGNGEWAKAQLASDTTTTPTTPTSTTKETTYYTSDGTKNTGYNIDGKTYKDQAGTQRIDEGSYVKTGDQWWQMGADKGYAVDTPEFIQSVQPSYQQFNSQYTDDIKNLIEAITNYQITPSMSRDEATARATSQLDGIYDANVENVINKYNKDAIGRGMFGQLPVEALKQNALASNELDKASAINNLSNDIYSQDFNQARQLDQQNYNKFNYLGNALNQGYGIEKDNYNIEQNEKENAIQALKQYSRDYQQRINDVTNDDDPSNDWEIPYLNVFRNEKIADNANQDNEMAEKNYEAAFNMFKSLGYASGWVAEALGVPEGTTTLDYLKANKTSTGGIGGSGDTGGTKQMTTAEKRLIMQMAQDQLTKTVTKTDVFGKTITEKVYPTYEEVQALYIQMAVDLGYDPSTLWDMEFILSDSENDMYNAISNEESKKGIYNK